ncbi:hypothetical protein EDD16DRAFT_1716447 [Pisolithus croceorrhizus]|nr:hypothetical protein EDD16DRAFT_1716447 [Pisolithus croceorrhizus]
MATVSHASSPIVAGPVPALETDSTWSKRKPTHLGVESAAPAQRGSVLSNAPSLVSNAPSANSGSSLSDVPSEATQKHAKLERLRRKLGKEVPADAVFPSSPRTPLTPRTAVPKTSKPTTDHVHMHALVLPTTVTLRPSTSHVRSHRSQKPKSGCHTSALPPVPHAPAHHSKSSGRSGADDDDAGLIRPRQQVAAGSKIGGSDFKAARRAKREGRSGHGEIGEMVEMVGFLGGDRGMTFDGCRSRRQRTSALDSRIAAEDLYATYEQRKYCLFSAMYALFALPHQHYIAFGQVDENEYDILLKR